MSEELGRRMSADERREQILQAALVVFAHGGYAGTSTDQVAREAGVSQPYVVRLFGSKQQLFAEAYARACQRIIDSLSGVAPGPDAKGEMGEAYLALVTDRDLLLMVMHGFAAGSEPEIGRLARWTLTEVFRMYRERTGGTPDDARAFIAHGMLINVMMASDAPQHLDGDPDLAALADCTFGHGLPAATADVEQPRLAPALTHAGAGAHR